MATFRTHQGRVYAGTDLHHRGPSITLAEFESLRREVERQAAQAEAPLELTPAQFSGLLRMRLTAGVPPLPASTLDLIVTAQQQRQQGES